MIDAAPAKPQFHRIELTSIYIEIAGRRHSPGGPAIAPAGAPLWATVKRQGYQQADSLTAKATNPILKAAAKPAADHLCKQSDAKAAGIVSEANRRADSLVAAARATGRRTR